MLPAASLAETTNTLEPTAKLIPFTVQLVVPTAVPVTDVVSFDQLTPTTPSLSLEIPPRVIELFTVEYDVPVVGFVMLIIGATVSGVI